MAKSLLYTPSAITVFWATVSVTSAIKPTSPKLLKQTTSSPFFISRFDASLLLIFTFIFPLFSTTLFFSKNIEFRVSQLGTATKLSG